MAAKSIVEIDVQDEKFQSFLEKFNEYQKALSELPEQWRGAVHGLGETAKETERVRDGTEAITKAFTDGVAVIASVNDGLDRLNGNLEKATKTQEEFSKKSSGARNFLNKASKDAKSLAGHIKDATSSLFSWGTVLGLFSGLAGAGGLWGLNRLAGNASAQRFTALGLGTTAGGLNASAVNYQKALGNPTGTLGAIRDAQLDLSKRWQFQAMGIDNPNQDPAALLPQMIRSARDIFVRNGSTQQGAEAYGLTNYFSLDDLNRFKNMSDAEIDAMAKQAQKDTQRLQLTDQQLRQWQDFNVQLDRSKVSIGNTFIRGLAPLAPELDKLSDAFSGAIETVLQSPELGKWIDGLSDGIRRFGNYLASPELKKDVEAFMSGVERLAHIIGKVIDWIAGKTSLSVDDVASGSSILGDKPVTDEKTGQSYVPGSESDPRVWGWLKSAKRASGVAPTTYDEYFEEAAKKYDLDPKLLKSVAAAESSWDQNAVSKAGAQGLMQVMPMNFQPGEDPFSPRDNIMAGARVMSWAKGQAGDDVEEMLRWYNGGKNRGSKENREYPGRVREKYVALYGSDMPGTNQSAPVAPQAQPGSGKTDQILQQILDNQKRGNAQGLVVYNNTGGSAIVSSTQLGGFG
ncbi:lytic transglycosylase domain-containing protein [Citrobacter koseri]|uniref:lytic transglycosylase domain-containing protein n=1 Tax=Citrobacter koseri TaxID=545 RepID=UPI00192B073F|nr:lytic transglycosylase domain-containing protein [Citrobacter koseri]MBL4562261.1 lytic transglycosylase domain-containing protein [Citrobacter koseri]